MKRLAELIQARRNDRNRAMTPTVETIWNEFSAKLGQFIRARVADPATAEDILQDVFVKLQSHLNEFRDPPKVQGWLFLVARNAIIDHYRTRKKTTAVSEAFPTEPPESDLEMEELKILFRRIVYGLPEPYRDALVLTEFEGLTQEELAKRLGISLSGAKSRVQRGRELLKERLLDACHREFRHSVGCQPCPSGLLPIVQARRATAKRNPKSRAKKSGK